MKKKRLEITIKSDRWVYLWLVIGALLLMLSTGRFGVALAAWLAPVFLIRFFRSQRVGMGYVFTLFFLFLAYGVAWRSILSFLIFESLPVYLVMAFFMALMGFATFSGRPLFSASPEGFHRYTGIPISGDYVVLPLQSSQPHGKFRDGGLRAIQ